MCERWRERKQRSNSPKLEGGAGRVSLEAVVNSPRKSPITELQFASPALLPDAEQHPLPSEDEDEMGAFAGLFTGGDIEASETEVGLRSQSSHKVVTQQTRASAGLRGWGGSPPRGSTELDANTSTPESGEPGGDRRRGRNREGVLQIPPPGRQQTLMTSLQDTTKLQEAFERLRKEGTGKQQPRTRSTATSWEERWEAISLGEKRGGGSSRGEQPALSQNRPDTGALL